MAKDISNSRLQQIQKEFSAQWEGVDKNVFPDAGALPSLAHYTSVSDPMRR